MPIKYSPALVAYVGVLAAGAVAAAVATVRLPADSALLAMGACATFLLAATAVKVLSGVGSFWSASIFAHLGLSLAAGPIGALVAVAGEVTGTNARFGVSWFKSVFNGSNQFLSNLAAWEVFHAMTGGGTSLGPGLLGGLTAGLVCWLVNIWLLAVVQRLTQPDLRMLRYVGQNAGAVLLYHLGAGITAFGGVVLVGREGADGFLLLLVPVLLLQISLLVLASRTQAAQLQREADARERELLLRRALEASDAERHRIARNLHDGVVQDLAAIALGLRSRAERDDETDGTTMLHAADATAEAIEELRTLLREIAPPDLQEIGLAAALDELAEPLRGEGVEVGIGLTPAAEEVRGTVLAAAYRITQEALRNVTQHASAHHVRVSVGSDGEPSRAGDRRRRRRLLRRESPPAGRGRASRSQPDPRPGARIRGRAGDPLRSRCGHHPPRAPPPRWGERSPDPRRRAIRVLTGPTGELPHGCDRVRVEPEKVLDVVIEGVVLEDPPAGGLAQAPPGTGVGPQPLHPVPKGGLQGLNRDDQAGAVQDGPVLAGAGGHDRATCRHRLEEREREALGGRGEHEDVGRPEQLRRSSLLTTPSNRTGDASPATRRSLRSWLPPPAMSRRWSGGQPRARNDLMSSSTRFSGSSRPR